MSFKIAPGEIVIFQGVRFQIVRLLDVSSLLAREIDKMELHRLYIRDLSPNINHLPVKERKKNRDIVELPEKEWTIAQERYSIILPLLTNIRNGELVARVAKEANVNKATLYRWIQKYEQSGMVSSLANEENTGGRNKSRLSDDIEAVIKSAIEEFYLSKQRYTIAKLHQEIQMICKLAKLKPPSLLTIHSRVNNLSEETRIARRIDKSVAKNRFEPMQGHFPGADYPLAVVQIDHTPLDVIVVDDIHRKPIGRPWITVAIDVYSRMILGFYISLDTPGALGTGLCISHAILPKEMWLTKMDVSGDWPCYGVMKSIHVDNAKEFHGLMLERACREYGIEINFRPVKNPKYGGHIERLLGTILKEIHTLPGTTFSNHTDRKYYNSEGKACMTTKEVEKWLTIFIVDVYHKRIHKGIKTTPFAKYSEGVLGNSEQAGIGICRPVFNEMKLRLDFMPYVERTIQEYGIVIDHVYYYHDIMKKWIHAYQKDSPKKRVKQKFIFKRDPRDISVIFFYDPEIKEYFSIPYRNTSLPPITIWEHREVLRVLEEKGRENIDEGKIFEAYKRMKEIQLSAEQKKKTVGLKGLRKKAKTAQAIGNSMKTILQNPKHSQFENLSIDYKIEKMNIKPFEDIEDDSFN